MSDLVNHDEAPRMNISGGIATLGIGIVALLSQGVLPALLGGLVADHRLDNAGVGLAAALEGLTMTAAAALAAIAMKPVRLRMIAILSSLVLAVSTLAVTVAGDQTQILALRFLAGLAEGVLLWIVLDSIAHAGLPERAIGILMACVTVTALIVATLLTREVLPAFGTNGGFLFVGIVSIAGTILAMKIADSRPRLASHNDMPKTTTRLGWISMLAALLLNAAGMNFQIYLMPLATHAGLDAAIGGIALTVLIGAQLAGSLLAAAIAGRVNYIAVLIAMAVIYAVIWPVYLAHPAPGAFIAVNGVHGLITYFALPFLYPSAIRADPARRAAVLLGPAQMLGTAIGPLLGALVLSRYDLFALLPLGMTLLVVAMALLIGVHLATTARDASSALDPKIQPNS